MFIFDHKVFGCYVLHPKEIINKDIYIGMCDTENFDPDILACELMENYNIKKLRIKSVSRSGGIKEVWFAHPPEIIPEKYLDGRIKTLSVFR
ncbi:MULTISPECIES: hypothetical protein [Vibrio]|uniref:Uncharacterized protein n=1 Tax=Vibrio algicola TaxID=2662262 RepID=A0A5Q0TIK6_9VIBR|nr:MULTISPECIES: hypothetical protein [Vibrio]MBD1576800.1 hypothetical protein [Vibrio sp. S11_S32]